MKKAFYSFIYYRLLGWKTNVTVPNYDKCVICAAPHTSNWKKGFYYIALKAQVPIMLIGIDYPSKTISSTKAVMPTGDIEKDMREIKLYFKNFKGKNPENFDLGNI